MQKQDLNLKGYEKRITAAEFFSSAVCPLNCEYCYIPKTKVMGDLQAKIIENMKNGTFIQDLKKFYGKRLQHIGLWGAEPTTTLKNFSKTLPLLLKTFPSLNSIGFSTSLMTDPDIIFEFINELRKYDRKISFHCQISLDGPEYINDINRIKGSSAKAPKNLFYLTEKINNLNLKDVNVDFSFKPTLTVQNISLFNKNKKLIKGFFDYFDNIFKTYGKKNKNKNASLKYASPITLTVPGKYTSEDGKKLALFFKNLRLLSLENRKNHYWKYIDNNLSSYTFRLARIIKNQEELSTAPSMFTCSGGDSNFGLGIINEMHICHRLFFLNHEEYINSILSQKNIENWDVSLFRKGNINLVNQKYSIDTKREKDWSQVLYILRNYHDFTRLKNSYVITMLKELAACGQADKEYLKNDSLCLLFAIFINSALSCPTENLLNTGSIYFIPVSLIRLFANGAFFEVLKDYNENISGRK